jgi:hypothetical protein
LGVLGCNEHEQALTRELEVLPVGVPQQVEVIPWEPPTFGQRRARLVKERQPKSRSPSVPNLDHAANLIKDPSLDGLDVGLPDLAHDREGFAGARL